MDSCHCWELGGVLFCIFLTNLLVGSCSVIAVLLPEGRVQCMCILAKLESVHSLSFSLNFGKNQRTVRKLSSDLLQE